MVLDKRDLFHHRPLLSACTPYLVIRGDGHFDLASRVKERDAATGYHHAPYSCVLGWCGLDGSLLKPFVLSAGESFEEQKADLRPYLEYARDVRQEFGLSSEESRPVAHCADTSMPRWCAATPATTS